MTYIEPEFTGSSDVEDAIARNVPKELSSVVIGVALNASDLEWAQRVCVRLATHPDSNVRGNALLGLGHLARRFGQLNRNIVVPLIEAGLHDEDSFVRGQAQAAFDDVSFFCNGC
ncbi:MAG: hypothetical protein ACRYFS_19225 [Janthinobacterium lividum]